MNRIILLFVVTIGTLFLAACNLNSDSAEESSAYTVLNGELLKESVDELLITAIENETDITLDDYKINITEVNNIENISITTFLLENNESQKKNKYGFLTANRTDKDKYEFHDFVINEITDEQPFSVFHYSGGTPTEVERTLRISVGYIHHEDISKILVNYDNNYTSAIMLGKEQETFTEINVGGSDEITSIVALSSEGNIIYEDTFAMH